MKRDNAIDLIIIGAALTSAQDYPLLRLIGNVALVAAGVVRIFLRD